MLLKKLHTNNLDVNFNGYVFIEKQKNGNLPLSTATSDEVVAVSTGDSSELALIVVSAVATINKGSVISCSTVVDTSWLVSESVNGTVPVKKVI